MWWRDFFVTIWCDTEKCYSVYLNDKGLTKTINIDSNFYSPEDDIIAYKEMIDTSSAQGKDKSKFLKRFIDYVKSMGHDLNVEYLKKQGIEL